MRILIIEDNEALASVVRRGLLESGHVVDVEYDGLAGAATAQSGSYDAIILDVMLPGMDGLSVAASLRSAGMKTPILMLTARDTADDAITGLRAGADDYVRKPFAFGELEARLHSITRREGAPAAREMLRTGDVVMDLASRTVSRAGTPIALSARETAFLEYFMRNEGMLLTRAMLENALWEADRDTVSNIIEVYVRRLRAKLSPNGEPSLIHTVRGAGYRFGIKP